MAALLALSAVGGIVRAQTEAAAVRGIVHDPTQAVIVGAIVTLTNTDQNRSWTAKTNASGRYDLEQIPPGNYSMTLEQPGFEKYHQPRLKLEVNQTAQIDVTLQPGSVTQTVTVQSEAPLLESASSSLGEVVNHLTTVALPLNGRDVMQLVALTPGINLPPSDRGAMPFSNGSIASVGFSANGARNLTSPVLLDGSPQDIMGYNQPGYVPPPDAVQEFKVISNAMSAEYGRTGGTVVNMVHRSGTKDFHGDLYEFLRNDKFDANDFFNNASGKSRAPFRFNQYGGTVGGPMTRSRQTTFFFFSYQGIREVQPGSAFYTVPTASMRSGGFAGISQIYDPSTINSAGSRQLFPNDTIPANRFDPVAVKLLSYFPAPNRPGIVNNYFTQAASTSTSNDYSVRIDRRISSRQNLFGRFSLVNEATNSANFFNDPGSPDSGISRNRSRSSTLDDSYVIGGWVLHGNFGYVYYTNPRDSYSEGFHITTLGLPAALANEAQFPVFPLIQPQGFSALGPNASYIIGNKFETYTATGDALKLIGDHTVKFGGVYRLNRLSNFRPNSPAGNFSFNQTWTGQVFNASSGGNSIASMLLGLMSAGSIQYQPALALEVPYYAAYFQDDWRVSDRLTLNLGIRWDGDRPLTERFDRLSSFNFNAPLPVQVTGLPPLHGGLEFAVRNGHPRGNKNPDNNNFAPRLGLAYKFTNNFVIRSGFGIFYNPSTGIGPGSASVGALTFDAITDVTTSTDAGRTPYTNLSNPFPDGFNKPTTGTQGLLSLLGQSINAQFRNDRTPYSAEWNFDLQYLFARDSLLDIAYVGNTGVKLLANSQLDQIPDADLALGSALTQKINSPFFGIAPATTAIGQKTTTLAQLLRPYPQFTGVTQEWGSLAHSNYHALEVKWHKRYANGLQFLAAYTWSKMIDDFSTVAGFLGTQNPGFTDNNKRSLDRALSIMDVPHHLVANAQYALPFGAGRRFLSHGWLAAVAGGWDINGIFTAQSGMPISITSNVNTTNSLGGTQRPNSTGISTRSSGGVEQRLDNYFNRAAFADPPLYTFGTLGRTLPDNLGPPLFNWDLSLLKQIPVREALHIELRGEFFNTFNNVNFRNPSGTVYGLPQFGDITATYDPRIIQVAAKFIF